MKICLLSWITYLLVTWWPKSARSPLRKLVKMAGSLMSSVSALASPQKMGIIQQQKIWGSQKGHHRCWDFGNFSKWFWDDRVAKLIAKTHQANSLGPLGRKPRGPALLVVLPTFIGPSRRHVIYHPWIFCPSNFCSYRIYKYKSQWVLSHILFHGLNLFSVLKSGLNQIKSDPHIKPQIFDIYLVGPTRSSIRQYWICSWIGGHERGGKAIWIPGSGRLNHLNPRKLYFFAAYTTLFH